MTMTMPIDINCAQFLAYTALALVTGAFVGAAIAFKIRNH